jgi:hypothetical protein
MTDVAIHAIHKEFLEDTDTAWVGKHASVAA